MGLDVGRDDDTLKGEIGPSLAIKLGYNEPQEIRMFPESHTERIRAT